MIPGDQRSGCPRIDELYGRHPSGDRGAQGHDPTRPNPAAAWGRRPPAGRQSRRPVAHPVRPAGSHRTIRHPNASSTSRAARDKGSAVRTDPTPCPPARARRTPAGPRRTARPRSAPANVESWCAPTRSASTAASVNCPVVDAGRSRTLHGAKLLPPMGIRLPGNRPRRRMKGRVRWDSVGRCRFRGRRDRSAGRLAPCEKDNGSRRPVRIPMPGIDRKAADRIGLRPSR